MGLVASLPGTLDFIHAPVRRLQQRADFGAVLGGSRYSDGAIAWQVAVIEQERGVTSPVGSAIWRMTDRPLYSGPELFIRTDAVTAVPSFAPSSSVLDRAAALWPADSAATPPKDVGARLLILLAEPAETDPAVAERLGVLLALHQEQVQEWSLHCLTLSLQGMESAGRIASGEVAARWTFGSDAGAMLWRLAGVAAGGGRPDGLALKGYCLLFGTGVAQDDGAGLDLLRAAASANSGMAEYLLGTAQETGLGGLVADLAAAIPHYMRGARLGYFAAERRLGEVLLTGTGGLPANAGTARILLDKAAGKGDAAAQFILGRALIHGSGGLERDPATGMSLLMRASEAGDADAAAEMAGREAWRLLIEAERAGAPAHLVRAAFDGTPARLTAIGRHFVGRDDHAARQWFERAAAADPEAATWLALAFVDGHGGCQPDLDRALALLTEAAEAGQVEAMEWLAHTLAWTMPFRQQPDRFAKALPWLRRAAEAGSPLACAGMARAALWGEGMAKAPGEAYAWAKQASEAGEPLGHYVLANCLWHGEGVPADRARAAALFARLIAEEHAGHPRWALTRDWDNAFIFAAARRYRGLYLAQSGRLEQGLALLEEAAAKGEDAAFADINAVLAQRERERSTLAGDVHWETTTYWVHGHPQVLTIGNSGDSFDGLYQAGASLNAAVSEALDFIRAGNWQICGVMPEIRSLIHSHDLSNSQGLGGIMGSTWAGGVGYAAPVTASWCLLLQRPCRR